MEGVKKKPASPDWRRKEEERLRAEADRLRAEAARIRARRANASAKGVKSTSESKGKNDRVSASRDAGEPRSFKQVRLCFVRNTGVT